MSLFRKKENAQTPRRSAELPRFGPGRRLESNQDLRSCVGTLSAVLGVHAPPRHAHMPALHEANVLWHGGNPLPSEAWTSDDSRDDKFVFVFWPIEGRTRIGLFPLGGREESLQTPLIGQWKQADPSLKSTGRFDQGLLTLLAPGVDRRYYEETLKIAGRAPTEENIRILARQVTEMFLIKAQQFIASRDTTAASRFVDDHPWTGDIELPARILEDLGRWNHQVIPYIQDLPGRVRGLLLEPGPDGHPAAVVWKQIRD